MDHQPRGSLSWTGGGGLIWSHCKVDLGIPGTEYRLQTIQRGGSTTVQSSQTSGMYKACKSQDKLLINGWACYQPSSVVPLSNKQPLRVNWPLLICVQIFSVVIVIVGDHIYFHLFLGGARPLKTTTSRTPPSMSFWPLKTNEWNLKNWGPLDSFDKVLHTCTS